MKVGLLIPSTSHGRSWKSYKESYLFNITLKSFMLTYNKEHNYTFYIGIDRNDPIYDNAITKEELNIYFSDTDNIEHKFIYMDNIKKGHLTKMWNVLFKIAYDANCEYFIQCGDDIEFKTKGWISDTIKRLEMHNNIGVSGPLSNNKLILTQTVVSRKHMEIFGYYFPEEIINWFCDDWINKVYHEIRHFYPLKNHHCINRGGNPRYIINNSNSKNRLHLNQIQQLYIKLANRDKEKINVFKEENNNTTKPSSFCTIATSPCSHELIGLLLSLSLFHPNETIYIMSDTKTKNIIEAMSPKPLLDIQWVIELDLYDGLNRSSMDKRGIWVDFMMSKSKILKHAISKSHDSLFLDADIIITDTICDIHKDYDVGVSPQFIKQEFLDKTGIYNGGMLWASNTKVCEEWMEHSKGSRYFDQAAIEEVVKTNKCFIFTEEYNVQAWRMLLSYESPKTIQSYITLKNNTLYYKTKPLKFIHTHFLDKRFSGFNTHIINLLMASKNYKLLLIIYRVIYNKWIFCMPKQPLLGMGFHTDDSFRELLPLMKKNNNDIDIVLNKDDINCWIKPNILAYDRDTLEWFNKDCLKASVVLLGNCNVEIEGKLIKNKMPSINVKPWIYWPRKPIIVEELLETYQSLSYDERKTESIFIGNIENNIQNKYRSDVAWKNNITEYICTRGKGKHAFSHKDYLIKISEAKYGLCLRGYGSKCHREVELMAFGTVPIITSDVCIDSYLDPPIENTHYVRIDNSDDYKRIISSISSEKWLQMSQACMAWYKKNVHSKNCWRNMIHYLLYEKECPSI